MLHKNKVELSNDQKQVLSSTYVDGSILRYSQAVRSHRTKLINENYLTTKNQVQIFDEILNGIERELKNKTNLSEILFKNKLQSEQTSFIMSCITLFNEGWKVVKAYNFYTQKGNSFKFNIFIKVVQTQNKSDFEKLGLIEVKKLDSKPKKKSFPKKKTKNEVSITYKGA